jgi:glyoxylate reductase
MGRIAKATARRALGFGMHVQFALPESHHRALQPTELGDLADRITQVGWRTLLESNDFVSIHLPLTEQTYHLFGAEAFAQMRASAILINTARGALVDEAALVRALQSRQIAGAGLDVYEYEPEVSSDLRALPQTTLLPHIGSATRSVRSEMARLCALNAVRMAAGDLPLHAINPQAWNRD